MSSINRFIRLGNYVLDTKAVAYISPLDTIVKAHINATFDFFRVVVGGQSVDLIFGTRAEATAARAELLKRYEGAEELAKSDAVQDTI